MSTLHNSPDPEGLTIAREIQDRLRPAEVILFGSRADGTHGPGSDVDLIAIAPDEAAAERTKETVREILGGRRGVPKVSVITTTQDEFQRWALLGQSFAGQAARYGVTPDGKSLDYRPAREPIADEIRELTIWWLRMAQSHLNLIAMYSKNRHLAHSEDLGLEAQWGLERSFKGLLAASNDTVKFRRDVALMWRHVESTNPIADREGVQAMESLLAATTGPGGLGCSLAAFTEAYLRDEPAPEISAPEWEAVRSCLPTAVDALITEALARSGAAREDLWRKRRGGRGRASGRATEPATRENRGGFFIPHPTPKLDSEIGQGTGERGAGP